MGNHLAILADETQPARLIIETASLTGYDRIDVFADNFESWNRDLITENPSRAFAGRKSTACFVALNDPKARAEAIANIPYDALVNIIHPTAFVSPTATLGRNNYVGAQAMIGTFARVGNGVFQNALSTIEHDNVIGNFCFFGTGAILCGRITLGSFVSVGGGATLKPGVSVGENAVIGTGAVVVKDLESDRTYVGNPAKPLEKPKAQTPIAPLIERITKSAKVDHTYKKLTGGAGAFARVKLQIDPAPATELKFNNHVPDGHVPQPFVPAVEAGVREALNHGVLAGAPVINAEVTLTDGAYHDVDSSAQAFERAANEAMEIILLDAGPELFEAIMAVTVMNLGDHVHPALSELGACGARSVDLSPPPESRITCELPLAQLDRLAAQLERLTKGAAELETEFLRYDPVPPNGDFPLAAAQRA